MASLLDIHPGQLCQTAGFVREDWNREKKDQNRKKGHNLEALCVFPLPPLPLVPSRSGLFSLTLLLLSFSVCSAPLSASLQAFSFQNQWGLHACVCSLPPSFSGYSCPFHPVLNPSASFSYSWRRIRNPKGVQAPASPRSASGCRQPQQKGLLLLLAGEAPGGFSEVPEWWRDLVAVFRVLQTPRKLNSFDLPWLLSTRADCKPFRNCWRLQKLSDFFWLIESFILLPLINPPPHTNLCFISLS